MTSLSTLPPFCLCFWHKLYFFSCTGGVLSLPQKTLNFNQKEEKERRWRYEYKVHAHPECCGWCAADCRRHLLLVQSGRGGAFGGTPVGRVPAAGRHRGDRGVCRGEQRDARLRLAVARRCSDGDYVAVPAFQPVVHDAVAAVPVHAVAAVFRRVAVRQLV